MQDEEKQENVNENTNEKQQTPKRLFWEIVRFLLVGGIATLVDYAIFYIFRQWLFPQTLFSWAGWDAWSLAIATACGFGVGLLVNWLLSVAFVFQDVKDKQQSSSKKSFWIFALIGVIGLAITEFGVLLLVYILPEITLFGTTEFLLPWEEWLSKILMTCIVLTFNYVARKTFIFK